MRQSIITLAVLCIALNATAEPVGRKAALYTAQSYLLSKGKNITDAQKPFRARGKAIVQTEDEADSYYYVFNASGGDGYVIVSGDDRTEPILGYVEHGTFNPDNIPENMQSWLQLYADQIKYIVENDVPATSPALSRRRKAIATMHSVPELLTCRWNQGSPENILCPKYYSGDGTEHLPAAGCVATAMAQIAYHYKWPAKTKTVIPAHSCTYTLDDGTKKTSSLPAIPRDTPIDWANMRDTYHWMDGQEPTVQDSAVAKLIVMCGQGVRMGYGGSSGAVSAYARDFFVKNLGYRTDAYWAPRDIYSIDGWTKLLYDELEAGYPVMFSGHSSGGGHAFVIDGFDGDNLFHVNWGWGGSSNGWFLIGILNPGDKSGIGASTTSDGYSMIQGALIGLRITDGKKPDPKTALSISNISVNETFIKGTWVNRTGSVGNFNAGIVKLEGDGTISLVGRAQSISSMAVDGSKLLTFNMRGTLTEGTHKLSPASKLTSGTKWHAQYNLYSEYIEANVDAEGNIDLRMVHPSTSIVIDTIEFPGTRIVDTQQEVKVRFRNNGDEFYRIVYLLTEKDGVLTYTENRAAVAVRKDETLEVSYFFTPKETGTYKLLFCTGTDGSGKVGEGTIDIVKSNQATKANLSVTAYTFTNSVKGVIYGGRLVGRATVKNNGTKDYHGRLRIQLWSQKIGESYAWSGPSRTLEVDIAAGKMALIDFDFDDLQTGVYYRLPIYYGSQEGNIGGAGIWDNAWEVQDGIIMWNSSGSISAQAARASLTVGTNVSGFYADCADITRINPNKNPNTLYAFSSKMTLPIGLEERNVVQDGRSPRISLVNDQPFYVPFTFVTDTATFTYTFPATEKGTGWHTMTLPIAADSIVVDSVPTSISDTTKHFWIYEFAAQEGEAEAIFAPAKVLRAGTPYLIAADSTMAGRSITFHAADASFYKSGTDRMVISSPKFKFHGTTCTSTVKNCYVLNAEGTAFEYVTKNTAVKGLNAYFVTSLADDLRPEQIALPAVPLPAPPLQHVKGDANGDDTVDIADVVSILNLMAASGFTEEADVNEDGTVDIADVVSVLNIMAQS